MPRTKMLTKTLRAKTAKTLSVLGAATVASGLALSIGLPAVPAAASSLSTTTLISGGLDGNGANYLSTFQQVKTLSADGRIAVYSIDSDNMVADDTNEGSDVFAYDRVTKKSTLISATPQGKPGNDESTTPTVSNDGRYIAYVTEAKDILPLQADMCTTFCEDQLIIHDRQTGKNSFASLDSNGKALGVYSPYSATISGDGHSVVFNALSDDPETTNYRVDSYVRNMQTGVTTLASVDNAGKPGTESCYSNSLSSDGRFVVFHTYDALVPEDTNGMTDVYVRDIKLNTTSWVSKGSEKNQGSFDGVVSDKGNKIAFASHATKLVPGDVVNNKQRNVFLYDVQSKTNKRIKPANGVNTNGYSDNPMISGDGRFVTFNSYATNYIPGHNTSTGGDIFIYDDSVGVIRRVNVPLKPAPEPTWSHNWVSGISADGKSIMFSSNDTSLTEVVLKEKWAANVYVVFNPVVNVPFYDQGDFTELLKGLGGSNSTYQKL